MKLLLIHGRGQGERTEQELLDEWTSALDRGYAAAGVPEPRDVDVRLPFYGAVLDDLTDALRTKTGRVLERGDQPQDVDTFQRDLLVGLAESAGIPRDEINRARATEVVKRGPENWEIVHTAGKLLSRKIPWLTRAFIARFTADVDAYLNFPHINRDINELILEHVDEDEPTVVVGHSLGSIVAYTILDRLGARPRVPTFVTVGSPLGLDAIKDKLRTPLGIPDGVEGWFNATDERDPVAMFSTLDATTFVDGIENHTDVTNPREHPHWIGGYLADQVVARHIARALVAT